MHQSTALQKAHRNSRLRMFGKHQLRYLDDPKKSLGEAEHVDILARA
jgi:hypothetical protein